LIISSHSELDEVDEFQDETSLEAVVTVKVSEVRELVVPPEFHGQRLDRMLVAGVPEFSRSYLQQLLEDGAVSRAGSPQLKSALKVKAGERWQIELRATPQSQAFKPETLALNVVYEDKDLRVIDKPAGLVVHPAPGNWSGTLMNGLLGLDSALMDLPRAGIVHRLDKDTSGLMVVARTRMAMDALVKKMADREIKRKYVALSDKPWTGSKQKTVELAIGRDPANRLRMAAVDLTKHSGKTAKTHFHLMSQSELGILVRCILETGRTHQIRVHMAALKLPLLGDTLYGGSPNALMPRQALHADHLSFAHPISGQPMVFNSPLPEDFQGLLQAWGLSYNENP
jgi:23S rRNA pseudouridine1911/1915/1917 synthase